MQLLLLLAFMRLLSEASVSAMTNPFSYEATTKGEQRLVVILVQFPDVRSTTTPQVIQQRLRELDAYYREASYGQAWVTSRLVEKWYQISASLAQLDIQKWDYDREDMSKLRTESIRIADPEINYRDYDYVMIIAAGRVWANAYSSLPVTTNDGVRSLHIAVANERSEMGVYAHELGHLLPSNYAPWKGRGLPDLYNYDTAKENSSREPFVGPWDIMDDDKPARHFSAYSKIMLGWIIPETVRPTATQLFIFTIQPLEKSADVRVVKIPIGSEAYYLIEVRRKLGFDRVLPEEGIVIYRVDDSKKSGYGIVRVVDRNSATKTLNDAAFRTEDRFEDNGVYILVILNDGSGFTIGISGRDPSRFDADADGIPDVEEVRRGTDRFKYDTDGDLWPDGIDLAPTNPFLPNALIAALIMIAVGAIVVIRRRRITPQEYAPKPTPPEPLVKRYCMNCGAEMQFSTTYCQKCGTKQSYADDTAHTL